MNTSGGCHNRDMSATDSNKNLNSNAADSPLGSRLSDWSTGSSKRHGQLIVSSDIRACLRGAHRKLQLCAVEFKVHGLGFRVFEAQGKMLNHHPICHMMQTRFVRPRPFNPKT